MENLAILAAKKVETWLGRQKRQERWFRGFVPPLPEAEDAAPPGEGAPAPETPDATDDQGVPAEEGTDEALPPPPSTDDAAAASLLRN